eukprot:SAG31_NODE_21141_length_557_cov_0.670306_1_plen_69_part_10
MHAAGINSSRPVHYNTRERPKLLLAEQDGATVPIAFTSAVGGLAPGEGCKVQSGVDWAFTLVQAIDLD